MLALKTKITLLFYLYSICLMTQDCLGMPWETIFNNIQSGEMFVVKGPDSDFRIYSHDSEIPENLQYSITGNKVAMIDLSDLAQNARLCKNNVFQYINGCWKVSPDIEIQPVSGNKGNLFNIRIKKPGFYKIVVGKDRVFLIADNSAMQSLRSHIFKLKNDIERKPDRELYRSCIMKGHINNFLKSKCNKLTHSKIEEASGVFTQYELYKSGQCPDFLKGINKFQFKLFNGAPTVEYVLTVPEGIGNSKSNPFVYNTDNAKFGINSNYSDFKKHLALWCHSITPEEHLDAEFEYVFNLIDSKLGIDRDRCYIVGKCGNGITAMNIALKKPDFWAGCYTSLGNSRRELAGNACSIDLRYSHGNAHRGELEIDGWYIFTTKCFDYHNFPNIGFSLEEISIDDKIIDMGIERNLQPDYIQHRITSLKDGESYWISITGREDENLPAEIKARIIENSIYISTDNIAAYSIDFNLCPIEEATVRILETNAVKGKLASPFKDELVKAAFILNKQTNQIKTITDQNETMADISEAGIFRRRPSGYVDSKYLKSNLLSGGFKEIFKRNFAIIYETGEEQGNNTIGKFAANIAYGAPCVSEMEKIGSLSDSHNILIITTKENLKTIPNSISQELPFNIDNSSILVDNMILPEDHCLVCTHPNPLNPHRYIGTVIIDKNLSLENLEKAFHSIWEKPDFDIGIFTYKENKIYWPMTEKLDPTWKIHSFYSQELTNVSKHKSWKWRSWEANVVREKLKADVSILEDCLRYRMDIPSGDITYRDIFNTFNNKWIVKVEIDGEDLKKILTTPFRNIKDRDVVPEISGASLIRNTNSETMFVGDIDPEKTYTLACPEKCLNGTRLGILPKSYKIVDEAFILPILLDHLKEPENTDLDKELISLEPYIF